MVNLSRVTRLLRLLALILPVITGAASCSSLGGSSPGILNNVENSGAVKMLLSPAVNNHLALALRNDSVEAQKLIVRISGGDISHYSIQPDSSGTVRASYILSESDLTLKPGDEKLVDIFLKNWFLTTANFSSRVRVDVVNASGRQRFVFEVNQDDIFDNSRQTIKDNRMGRNNPYGSSYVKVCLGGAAGEHCAEDSSGYREIK